MNQSLVDCQEDGLRLSNVPLRTEESNSGSSIEVPSFSFRNTSSTSTESRPNNSLVSEQEDNGEEDEAAETASASPVVQVEGDEGVQQQPQQETAFHDPAVAGNEEVAPSPAQIPEDDDYEDESDYEYEEEDDMHYAGFLDQKDASASNNGDTSSTTVATASNPATVSVSATSTWKEPSRQAVDMSLRAEKETSGGKRRLASDLFRIMVADTKEAGFSLEPKSEDCMDKWIIKMFEFDPDSNLHKDMMALGVENIELEMSFPDQYPFAPPFVRVVRPRFQRLTGFVMNGALCMELLTNEGWNPVNDIESVIVSIRSLLVVGDGRLEGAPSTAAVATASASTSKKRARDEHYTIAEAKAAYSHLSEYHKKKGWDNTGWWARKG